jgi:hypothetical protein
MVIAIVTTLKIVAASATARSAARRPVRTLPFVHSATIESQEKKIALHIFWACALPATSIPK